MFIPGPAASIPVTTAPFSYKASDNIPPPQPTSKTFLLDISNLSKI